MFVYLCIYIYRLYKCLFFVLFMFRTQNTQHQQWELPAGSSEAPMAQMVT